MHIIDLIKGVLIGIAFVIPGLSGSVFAVLTGLYDKIIFSINNIKHDFKNQLIFLLPIVLGVVIGILSSTKLILFLCITYPLFSYSFFIGLVIGSLPFVLNKIPNVKINFKNVFLCIFSLLLILLLASLEKESNNYIAIEKITGLKDILILFFSGIFSCSLMSIPGVSGSVLLMVINQYGTVYNAVSKFSDVLKNLLSGDIASAFQNLESVFLIIPFLLGALIGIVVIAKLLAVIIEKHHDTLYVCVIGVVMAAAITLFNKGIFININELTLGLGTFLNIIICAALMATGYFTSKIF